MVMSNKGNLTPNPRQQFITDMTPLFIQDKQTLGREILLMMDANEETSPTNRGIVNLFHDFSLLNLMEALHPGKATPTTHDRGTKTIDHMFGSLQVRNSMTRGAIYPFIISFRRTTVACISILMPPGCLGVFRRKGIGLS